MRPCQSNSSSCSAKCIGATHFAASSSCRLPKPEEVWGCGAPAVDSFGPKKVSSLRPSIFRKGSRWHISAHFCFLPSGVSRTTTESAAKPTNGALLGPNGNSDATPPLQFRQVTLAFFLAGSCTTIVESKAYRHSGRKIRWTSPWHLQNTPHRFQCPGLHGLVPAGVAWHRCLPHSGCIRAALRDPLCCSSQNNTTLNSALSCLRISDQTTETTTHAQHVTVALVIEA